MLNRRLLRVKVFQSLYAMHHAYKGVEAEALGRIATHFVKDLMAEVALDEALLEAQKKKAQALFLEELAADFPQNDYGDEALPVIAAVNDGIAFYKRASIDEKQRQARLMIGGCTSIDDLYLRILGLLVALSEQVLQEDKESRQKHINPGPLPERRKRLLTNRYMQGLVHWEELTWELAKRDLAVEAEEDWARRLYREALRKDETLQAWLDQETFTPEDELALMRHLTKSLLERYDQSATWFDQLSLHWAENASVVRSMVYRTFKTIGEVGKPEFVVLSTDWEDDEEFALRLFNGAWDNWDAYTPMLTQLLVKWDVERVALADMILIKMALTEMLQVESIPVKVTINEYVELAKHYSTENSSTFINGVIDAAADQLKAQGRLKKSGKGLME